MTVKGGGFIRSADRGTGEGGAANRSLRHVTAENFGVVDVNNGAIVAQDVDGQLRDGGWIRERESASKISRNEFLIRVSAETESRGFVSIAVTKLGGTGFP